MGKLDNYIIPLRELPEGTHEYEFHLDDDFFTEVNGPEVSRGDVDAFVSLKKTGYAFEFSFKLEGSIVIPCDRCLSDMEQEIDCVSNLLVKFGSEYSEEDNLVVVPEAEGVIDLSWYLYETVALDIPIRHVHEDGECDEGMAQKLSKHIALSSEEALEQAGEAEEDDEGRQIDPRWAELIKLKNNN